MLLLDFFNNKKNRHNCDFIRIGRSKTDIHVAKPNMHYDTSGDKVLRSVSDE